MAQIRFTGAGTGTTFTYTFISDDELTETLVRFTECVEEGGGGLWLPTPDGALWLPVGTPLLADYDNGRPDGLLDRLAAVGRDEPSEPFVIG